VAVLFQPASQLPRGSHQLRQCRLATGYCIHKQRLVHQTESLAYGHAPACTSAVTAGTWPLWIAWKSGVSPTVLRRLSSAPASSRHTNVFVLLARWSAVFPRVVTVCMHVRSQLHQRPHRLHVPVDRRVVKRPPSVSSCCVHVRSQLYQRSHRLNVPVVCCGVKRPHSTKTLRIRVDPKRRQPPHLRHLAIACAARISSITTSTPLSPPPNPTRQMPTVYRSSLSPRGLTPSFSTCPRTTRHDGNQGLVCPRNHGGRRAPTTVRAQP
jgi:hypothetical protein